MINVSVQHVERIDHYDATPATCPPFTVAEIITNGGVAKVFLPYGSRLVVCNNVDEQGAGNVTR